MYKNARNIEEYKNTFKEQNESVQLVSISLVESTKL